MQASNKKTESMIVSNSAVPNNARFAQLKEATIMMVDDEPIMLDIVQALLEDEGYRNFISVQQSSQAIETMVQANPDILLLDLDMPEINGFDILKEVRALDDFEFLPVIILTASGEAENKLKALELGATDFLSKPVDPSELALRVRNTLSAKAYQDQLAYYDNLTGLPNRKMFIDRLSWGIELAKRESRPLALLDIGLDRFRQINETLGPTIGDRVLQAIAERLSEVLRSSDVIARTDSMQQMENMARTGGDEFSIVMCGVNSLENASTVSKRVLDAIKRPITVDKDEIFLTASIGIAVYPEDGEGTESLIKHAGSAKDFAKKQGTDNYQFYSSEMNALSRVRLKMESDLRKALEKNELELNYQPKVDPVSGEVVGMEALLRWFHSSDGLVSPVNFIPVAEDMGLIVPIGEWVLHEACRQTSEWVQAGHDNLVMSVNVSVQQFTDASLKDSIISALETSGLDPKHLILEITESMLMGNIEHYINLLNEIKALGISFAIDDFGTGYSSLSYLKRFPIDELKIDRSFLEGVPSRNDDNSIVKAIIAMAHSLGHTVVAEGVENEEQLDFLRQHNCDAIQGYFFSKPLNAVAFSRYLSSE